MKIESGQLCLACGEKPATVAQGTVPLCSECASKAKGKGRGVTVQPKPKKTKTSAVRPV
jgi:hypothetical protein